MLQQLIKQTSLPVPSSCPPVGDSDAETAWSKDGSARNNYRGAYFLLSSNLFWTTVISYLTVHSKGSVRSSRSCEAPKPDTEPCSPGKTDTGCARNCGAQADSLVGHFDFGANVRALAHPLETPAGPNALAPAAHGQSAVPRDYRPATRRATFDDRAASRSVRRCLAGATGWSRART
jgi:hypothetical protein